MPVIRMVDVHIARRGVSDERVLEAMRTVPRENFVETGFEEFAYEDAPLPIAEGQAISQPFIVARMIEAAELEPADRVLEVGTGSGYAAAIISLLVDKVFGIERHDKLAETARRRMKVGGYLPLRTIKKSPAENLRISPRQAAAFFAA